jgi:uncharacterized glyoxalase superfamily protein PhnB
MHVHLVVDGSSPMPGDACPEHGHAAPPLAGAITTPMVEDIRAWWDRAVATGTTSVMAPKVMVRGDTQARLADPFGIPWALDQAQR